MARAKPVKPPKPTRPYPSFPLTPHANGQWCKKIRGKVHFFGVWADPQAAVENYRRNAADLHSGNVISAARDEVLTLNELGNAYLQCQHERGTSGEIGLRSFEDSRRVATLSSRRHAAILPLSTRGSPAKGAAFSQA